MQPLYRQHPYFLSEYLKEVRAKQTSLVAGSPLVIPPLCSFYFARLFCYIFFSYAFSYIKTNVYVFHGVTVVHGGEL